ncbi:MAG: tRNA (cytidine(34)-2'-O)-methyltransferase [Planctomycetes bacterium]|nr:tRNA (cytidine(34)-2'-O)-methyltransferase [Planctomycetota bacterium]
MGIHLALIEPEIPPNTGNVARLCAATGTVLHLVGRLGFRLDDRSLRRAGIDYWPAVEWRRHVSFDDFEMAIAPARLICFSAHAERLYTGTRYQDGDCLVFGSESRGLPQALLERFRETAVTIPMPGKSAPQVRSLNLSTAAGIGLYEALRQVHGW